MIRILLYLFPLLAVQHSLAFTVKGSVSDKQGNRLPYTNIFVKGTSYATSANTNGDYSLELKEGKYEIVFQHMGFAQKIVEISLSANSELNVVMEPLAYSIADVVVSSTANPADEVIRKAIEKRKYFLNAVESYSCDAYVKGMQRLLDAPTWVINRIKKRGVIVDPRKPNILYLSESFSKLYYKKPGRYKEVIHSSKVSGRSEGFTYNSAQDFYFNFYERSIPIEGVSSRPLISPLSESAFSYYRFKMIGAYKEGNYLINKIQVTPKRKGDPCFSGVLSVVEDLWNIHSLELYVTSDNGIQFLDTLRVTQYFIPVKEDIWLPAQQRYDAKASFLGVRGDGYYLGVFKNYELNSIGSPGPKSPPSVAAPAKKSVAARKIIREQKKEEKKIFTPEIIKVAENANKHEEVYWDSIRPVPLTELEIEDYELKDSIETIKETKSFKDSTDKSLNKPGLMSLLTGYRLVKQYRKIEVRFPSLINIFNYNTVEGLNIQFKFRIQKSFETNGRRLWVEPVFRYGVSNRSFNAMATINYRNNQLCDENFSISGGKFISQFNETQPQPPFGNNWQSLIFGNNFMKLYEQYFLRLSYNRELFNGVFSNVALLYARRNPLENTSLVTIFPKSRANYTENGVSLPDVPSIYNNITKHDVFRIDLSMRIVFGQKYITRPNLKIRTPSKFPVLLLFYRRAIPVKNFSDLNYDFVEARLEGDVALKQAGTLFYKFGGGGFPYVKKMQFTDFRHFFGNFLNQGETDMLGFYNVGYYRHSTARYFAEAHLEHHFDGLFLNKIPGIRKLKLEEVLGFHFLYTPTRKQYFQLDLGIENIFRILRADFVAGFGSGKNEFYFGGRVGLALDFRQ